MKHSKVHSITLKLILLFIIMILVPTVTTTLTTMQVMTNREERELHDHAKTGLNRAKTLLVQLLSRAENIARLLAGINDIKQHMAGDEVQELLDARRDLWFPAIVEVFDTKNNLVARSSARGRGDEAYFTANDDPTIQAALNLSITTDLYPTNTGPVAKAAAPIVDYATLDVRGAVVVTFPLNDLFVQAVKEDVKADILLQWSEQGDANTTIMNSDGEALTRVQPVTAFEPIDKESPVTHETIHGDRYGVARTHLADNQGRILAILATAVNFNTLTKNKKANLRLLTISASIILIVAVILGLATALTVTRPIVQLLRATRRVAAGDLEERVQIKNTDEIGELADAFNDMAAHLQKKQTQLIKAGQAKDEYAHKLEESYAQLAKFNTELEDLVGERTAELRAANEKLQELDAMKTGFLSTVSHELRTPMTSVYGFAKIIKKRMEKVILPHVTGADPKLEATVRQMTDNLDVIVSEAERLTDLINDVLDIAKMEAGKLQWKKERLSMESLIQRAVTATKPLCEDKPYTVQTDIEPYIPEIIGDSDRLLQVLINLISNAAKFTAQGGITVQARHDGDQVRVSVVDTGVGIPSVFQPKVFERFSQMGDTLTGKPHGTGLGLSICRQIIEHHGGHIDLESQPGVGSTFYFTLPYRWMDPDGELNLRESGARRKRLPSPNEGSNHS